MWEGIIHRDFPFAVIRRAPIYPLHFFRLASREYRYVYATKKKKTKKKIGASRKTFDFRTLRLLSGSDRTDIEVIMEVEVAIEVEVPIALDVEVARSSIIITIIVITVVVRIFYFIFYIIIMIIIIIQLCKHKVTILSSTMRNPRC